MMKKIRDMAWEMHFLHLTFFALGTIALIVLVIHHDNPKLGMDPLLLLIPTGGLMGGAIYSFIRCLLDKPEGQYQKPRTFQQEESHELTATH